MAPTIPRHLVRNVGIVAHIDAGKTTTSERFLYYAGRSHRIGEVHDGEAILDFRADERERGITISAAATTLAWNGYQINLIDTPGHVDFTAEVERALRVLDGAVVVFDGVEGVEPQSETVWHQADRYEVPRVAFVNKMDRVGASFDGSVRSIRERLGAVGIPIQLPDGEAEAFRGIVDLVTLEYLRFEPASLGKEVVRAAIPEALRARAEACRESMVEALAERFDPLAEVWLDGSAPAPDLVHRAIRDVTLRRTAVPVLCGAALRNIGIQPVLDAVGRYLPSPLDVPAVRGTVPSTGAVEQRAPEVDAPFCALLFKVVANPAADLFYLRAYSGAMESGARLLNARTGKGVRLRRMMRMHADRGEAVERLQAGDIVAAAGLADAVTGDTLCDPEHPILLETIRFPDTVVSIAVEPRTTADRDRLWELLDRFRREDPTLDFKTDPETGQSLLSGMGELHLEVVLQRMQRDFGLHVLAGKPRVSYRETVAAAARAASEYSRKIGDDQLWARVEAGIAPTVPAAAPAEFVDATARGRVPGAYLPAIRESLLNAAAGGGLYGYPVTGVLVSLHDAQFADAGQPEIALNSAASMTFRELLMRAGPIVLEPYGRLEVRVPEDCLGGAVKTLHHRRALVEDTAYHRDAVTIRGVVPIAEMFGFLTVLRSQTQGRGTFSLEPLDFRPVPENLVAQQHHRLYGD